MTKSSQQQLVRQREIYWETRVEGSAITWGALRSACEAMLDNDLALVNAILEVRSPEHYFDIY